MTLLKTVKVNTNVRELFRLELFEPSFSPCACGLVMLEKKRNQLRMCCDFGNLNARTVKEAFRYRESMKCSNRLGSAKFFTGLDIQSAFWHLWHNGIYYKTVFACLLGLFQWDVKVHGLCNSPPNFQANDFGFLKGSTTCLWEPTFLLHRRCSHCDFLARGPFVSTPRSFHRYLERRAEIEP